MSVAWSAAIPARSPARTRPATSPAARTAMSAGWSAATNPAHDHRLLGEPAMSPSNAGGSRARRRARRLQLRQHQRLDRVAERSPAAAARTFSTILGGFVGINIAGGIDHEFDRVRQRRARRTNTEAGGFAGTNDGTISGSQAIGVTVVSLDNRPAASSASTGVRRRSPIPARPAIVAAPATARRADSSARTPGQIIDSSAIGTVVGDRTAQRRRRLRRQQ